jgi:hypothetical protein
MVARGVRNHLRSGGLQLPLAPQGAVNRLFHAGAFVPAHFASPHQRFRIILIPSR